MVESYKPSNKRQKKEHVHPNETIKERLRSNKKEDKAKEAEDSGLVNVNVEEYKQNPEIFEEELKQESGTQVIIQFKDAEEKEIGVQISLDSLASKRDLNEMLAEFLPK